MEAQDQRVQMKRRWHKLMMQRFIHGTRPLRRRIRDFRRGSRGDARESNSLVADLSRLFLSDLVADRVAYLKQHGAGEISTEQQNQVSQGYSSRLAIAIREEAALESPADSIWAPLFAAAEIDKITISGPLSAADFMSARHFVAMLGTVRHPKGVRLRARAGSAIAGIWLRALQRVALGVVREDYPRTVVPVSTQRAIRELLQRIDRISRSLEPRRPPLPFTRAEAILRVGEARNDGRVWLPLRPIPTAALTFEQEEKYFGRSDDEALRLARQIRHADGAILVTGYRGVGKSTFINRVLFHIKSAQSGSPADNWVLVPIVISLAKVAGVKNILRLTVKAVHANLLHSDATSKPIPGSLGGLRLPLRDDERTLLQSAYERATLKVALTREDTVEQKQEAAGSIKLDPGKLVGLSGTSVSFGGSRSRIRKLNRQLGLLDYDENAAEEDLSSLIQMLAEERPLRQRGTLCRIKLVFVFDELDKMDPEKGLKPMIEGLKNLFLQQHAVFILATSKKFYYDLLGARAKEDELLNSYFSAIVHVPLLTFSEVRKLLEHWIDLDAINAGADPLGANETKLLDLIARFLTYRSLGNPREIIRELRQMEVWSEGGERPYLTDHISKLPEVPIFAAIQEAIELVATPQVAPGVENDANRGVTLVSERLKSDQARLEQLRRGLYILAEEIINRQILNLRGPDLAELQANNFSQLSTADVIQVASRLASQLKALVGRPLLYSMVPTGETSLPALFTIETSAGEDYEIVKATENFYTLIGRRPSLEPAGSDAQQQTRTIEQLVQDAESLATHTGRAERLSTINLIGEILERSPEKLSKTLRTHLFEFVTKDSDAGYRNAAASHLRKEMVFDASLDVFGRMENEPDERVLSAFVKLLGQATTAEERTFATKSLRALLARTFENDPFNTQEIKLSDAHLIDLLTALQIVANQDITSHLLDWMANRSRSDSVMSVATRVFNINASANGANPVDRLLANEKALIRLIAREIVDVKITAWSRLLQPQKSTGTIEQWLKEVMSQQITRSADWLLRQKTLRPLLQGQIPVLGGVTEQFNSAAVPLLAHLWEVAVDRLDGEAAALILRTLAQMSTPFEYKLAAGSLAEVRDFNTRMQPFLERKLQEMTSTNADGSPAAFSDEEAQRIRSALDTIRSATKGPESVNTPLTNLGPLSDAILKDYQSLPGVKNRSASGGWIRTVCGIIGTIAFPSNVFLIGREDLAARGLSVVLPNRLTILLADVVGFVLLWALGRAITSSDFRSLAKSDSSSVNSPWGNTADTFRSLSGSFSGFLILYGLYWTHQQLGGTLSRGTQIAIAAINFVIIACWAYVLSPLLQKR